MGCQSSSVQKPLGIRINILDSNFTKQQNQKIRQKMDKLDIQYQTYLSLSCFIEDMLKVYTNEVVTTKQLLDTLIKQLTKVNFKPNIYVLSSDQAKIEKPEYAKFPIKYFKFYDQIIQDLTQKTEKKRKSGLNPAFQKAKQKIVLKIFRKKSKKSSQQLIFQQTLKSKNVTYQIYQEFSELQSSIQTKTSNFIVTDYVYHREVINLVQNSPTRVICYCEFNKNESYDPRVYFVTNNFLQIVTQIVSEQKLSNFNLVKCSKVYIYTNEEKSLGQYAETIENFDFQVKIYSDLTKIISQSKLFFAVTIIISPDDRKEVERILEKNDYMFKTKLVQIQKGTQNTVKALRKTLKQLKKGYRALKGMTRTIDIIDKHFDNVKFDTIKKQLDKYEIKCYGYTNLSDYIKQKKFISPFIICNFEQRSLIVRYLKQVQSKSKIILFCNKNHISSELKQNKAFAFVSSHFGKILNFVKKNSVYNPMIVDENDLAIKEKKEKLKRNNKRISALGWASGGPGQHQDKDTLEKEKAFEFLNVKADTTQNNVLQIQKQFASLFKLQYCPVQNPTKAKSSLIQSLRQLKNLLKINYPEQQFQKMLSQISPLSTSSILSKITDFFSSQNHMGVKINKSLIDVEKLSKEMIEALRWYLLYVNLNFLTVYRDPFVGRVRLYHYMEDELIEKCKPGSYLLNKSYSIFYQPERGINAKDDNITSYRVQMELQGNTLAETDSQFNSFFRYKDKFVFSPYSQFLVKSIAKQNDVTVIQVSYKKNVEYLKHYFKQNMHKSTKNLLYLYEQQLSKSKTSLQQSFLFNQTTRQQFNCNVIRTKAMTYFQNQKLQQAIKLQKQVIIREQNLENFDSTKQEWLNYELACFYFKLQNHTQCKRIIKQLIEAEPSQFLKEKLMSFNRYYSEKKKSAKDVTESINQCEENFRNIVIEPTIANYYTVENDELHEIEEKSQSDQQNIFDPVQIQNEIPCLDLEKADDFEAEFKENIC